MKDPKGNTLNDGDAVAYSDKQKVVTGIILSISKAGKVRIKPHDLDNLAVNRQAKNILSIVAKKPEVITKTVKHTVVKEVDVETPITTFLIVLVGGILVGGMITCSALRFFGVV